MRLIIAILLIATPSVSAETAAPKAHPIKLSSVWGYDLPGTKDINTIENVPKGLPAEELLQRSAVARFRQLLALTAKNRESDVGPALVVEGSGVTALANAYDTLRRYQQGEDPQRVFTAGREASVVFYTRSSSFYVRIDSIERTARELIINYHFEQHATYDLSTHFAIIPIGKPDGRVRVKVKQLAGRGPRMPGSEPEVKYFRDKEYLVSSTSTYMFQPPADK